MRGLIYHHRNKILFLYLGIAVFFLLRLESIFNGGFFYSMQILCLPLAVIIFGYSWLYRSYFYRVNKSKIVTWTVVILFYGLTLLMTWPYVMAFNAFTGSGEKVIYEGPIEEKWISKGKHWSYHLEIRDQKTLKTVTLNCSKNFYNSVSEGDYISDHFYMGGLGFPYRWK